MALPVDTIELREAGLRGETFADVARRVGTFSTLASDTDDQVLQKFGNWALQENPSLVGPKGDPGGNVMTVGLASSIAAQTVPMGADLIQTAGNSAAGIGKAQYVKTGTAGDAPITLTDLSGQHFIINERTPDFYQAGCAGDGATDDTANAQALINFRAGQHLRVEKGTFKLNSLVIPSGGLIIEGRGEDSVLTVTGANQNLIKAIAGGKLRLYNVRLIGDGTASAYAQGCGLYTEDVDIDLDWLWLQGFGAHGAFLKTTTSGHSVSIGVVRGIEQRNPLDPSSYTGEDDGSGNLRNGNESADLLIIGPWDSVRIGNFRGQTSAAPNDGTVGAGNGILIANSADTEAIGRVEIGSVYGKGYRKRLVSVANNYQDAFLSKGPVHIGSVEGEDIQWSMVKTKFVSNVSIDSAVGRNIEFDSDGDPAAEILDNLQGAVFINGSEQIAIGSVLIDGCGTDALRVQGNHLDPQPADAGLGRERCAVGRVVARGAGAAAVSITQAVRDVAVGEVIAGECYDGVRIYQSTLHPSQTAITFGSVKVRNAGRSSVFILGRTDNYVGSVVFNDLQSESPQQYGIFAEYVDSIRIKGGALLNSGQSAPTGSYNGFQIADAGYVEIKGVRSGNTGDNTSQCFAGRLSGAIGEYHIHDNDFANNRSNGSTDIFQDGATVTGRKRSSNNSPVHEKTFTASLGTIAAGAIASTGTTVRGLEVGDPVEVTLSGQDAGLAVRGVVTAANTVGVRVINQTASAIVTSDPATIKVVGRKMQG